MRPSFRPGLAADLPAIVALENACFSGDRLSPRALRHHLANTRAALSLLTLDNTPSGYVLVLFHGGRPALARLYSYALLPAYRGRGLGALLLSQGIRLARDRGCARLRLEVRADNTPSIILIKRLGFVRFGEVPRYYQDGATALRFEIELPTPLRDGLDAESPLLISE